MIYTHPYAYASDHMEPSDFLSVQSVTMGITAAVLFITGIVSGIVGVIALSGVVAVIAGGFSIVAAIKAVEDAMAQTSEAPAPVHTPASL